MNRRTRIVALFVVLFILQVALLICWHVEAGAPLRAKDVIVGLVTMIVMGVIYFFSARYYLRAIDRAVALHAAQASVELERSLELYHSMAEREERLVRQICATIEQGLAQAQEELAQGKVDEVDNCLQRSLDAASESPLPRCENAIIGAVLEAVSHQFASESVTLTARTDIPAEIDLPDIEIAAVLFNLADEAIGNCRALREADPTTEASVIMRIATEAGQLVIEAESPERAAKKARFGARKNTARAAKKSWSAKVIEDFVYSHDGFVEYAHAEGISRTSAMIPLGTLSEH